MLSSPARLCFVVTRQGVLPIKKNSLVHAVTGYGRRGKHDKGSCCKEVAQTEGKRVEAWPKSDPPPPAWRATCPSSPQPPNYDPYRIKVPDVVVPPLPPSDAKRAVVLTTGQPGDQGYQQQGYQQQGYQQEAQPEAKQEDESEEGFMGMIKRWFGGGKSKEDDKGSGQQMMVPHTANVHYEIPNEDGKELFGNPHVHIGGACPGSVQDMFYNSPIVHPDYWKPKPEKKLQEVVRSDMPKLGYHGRSKYKYAFHEPWKPLDRMGLLEQAEREDSGGPEEAEVVEKTKQLT